MFSHIDVLADSLFEARGDLERDNIQLLTTLVHAMLI
jgi:hypothetical protein